jgi:hypothetical protein
MYIYVHNIIKANLVERKKKKQKKEKRITGFFLV